MKNKFFFSIFLSLLLLILATVPALAEDNVAIIDESLNGLVWCDDGKIRFYVDGVSSYAGLVQSDAGDYYYISGSTGNTALVNSSYYVSKTNGLLPSGTYYFGPDGKLLFQNGLISDSDGEYRYYVDGVAQLGVVQDPEGNFYYMNSTYVASKNIQMIIPDHLTNGLIEAGSYFIDSDGHIIDPIVVFPEPDELYYLERIYILLFVIAAFTVCGIFISRPRRWI